MEQSNVKLCWLHNNYKLNYGPNRCNSSSSLSENSDLPKCHIDCNTYTKCKRAFELAGFPNAFWNPPCKLIMSPEDVQPMAVTQHVRQNISSFVANGQNLWIWSSTSGNGKSYRASVIGITYILTQVLQGNKVENCIKYVYIPKLITDYELADMYSYDNDKRQQFLDYVDSLNDSDLVIWDGLGYGSDSRIETVIIRAIINNRLNSNKSNLFISNKSLPEVNNIIGKDLYQRLNNSSLIVSFSGPDLRTNNIFETNR